MSTLKLDTLPDVSIPKLSSGWDRTPTSMVFGHLIRLATDAGDEDRVGHYHGDLFHDALWLDRNCPPVLADGGRFVFYFGFNAWGSAIGLDPELVQCSRKRCYRVTVYRSGLSYGLIVRAVVR